MSSDKINKDLSTNETKQSETAAVNFLSEIEEAFPDHLIYMEKWNHDRWDEPMVTLCRQLGYTRGDTFLKLKGFRIASVETATDSVRESSSESFQNSELYPDEIKNDEPAFIYDAVPQTGINLQRQLSVPSAEHTSHWNPDIDDLLKSEPTENTEDIELKTDETEEELPQLTQEQLRSLAIAAARNTNASAMFEASFAADPAVFFREDTELEYSKEDTSDETDAEDTAGKRENNESAGSIERKAFENKKKNRRASNRFKRPVVAIITGALLLIVLAVILRNAIYQSEEKRQISASEDTEVTYAEGGDFAVSITLPHAYVDAELTQKDYNILAEQAGYEKILIRVDDSVTYIMSRSRQYEMITSVSDEIELYLQSRGGEDCLGTISSITADADYTKFEIKLETNEITDAVNEAVEQLAWYAGKYGYVSGKINPVCEVAIYGVDGEKIDVLNPKVP